MNHRGEISTMKTVLKTPMKATEEDSNKCKDIPASWSKRIKNATMPKTPPNNSETGSNFSEDQWERGTGEGPCVPPPGMWALAPASTLTLKEALGGSRNGSLTGRAGLRADRSTSPRSSVKKQGYSKLKGTFKKQFSCRIFLFLSLSFLLQTHTHTYTIKSKQTTSVKAKSMID